MLHMFGSGNEEKNLSKKKSERPIEDEDGRKIGKRKMTRKKAREAIKTKKVLGPAVFAIPGNIDQKNEIKTEDQKIREVRKILKEQKREAFQEMADNYRSGNLKEKAEHYYLEIENDINETDSYVNKVKKMTDDINGEIEKIFDELKSVVESGTKSEEAGAPEVILDESGSNPEETIGFGVVASGPESEEKGMEKFSEYEIAMIKVYKEDIEEMFDFIRKFDYVGELGFDEENVESFIASETKRFLDIFSDDMINENDFSSQEKAEEAFRMMKSELEKPVRAEGITEEKADPERAVSWHTIYRLENSPDLTYKDLDASTMEERDQKFIELTRKLWAEFSVHGVSPRINEKGEVYLPCESDLDGESYLKILELAGFAIDRNKVNFVKMGEMPEEGVIGDTSNKNGVIAEEKGKRIIFDHHTPDAGRDSSTTKYAYETLAKMGFLEKEEYLDKYVEFVTKYDNFEFSPEETKKVYKNYPKNLYGLGNRMKNEDILECFKQGKDPFEKLPDDYLKTHTYFNPSPKVNKEESLLKLSNFIEKQIKSGKEKISELKKNGWVVDTGDDRFGKILIDTKKMISNGRWYPKIDDANHSSQLEIRLKGYGGYLIWSQAENSFTLYTNRRMDGDSVPGGFPQGENIRGHMLIKGLSNPEPLKLKMEDIFSKLSGKSFEFEKKLKENIYAESKSREMVDLISKGDLTEADLRSGATASGVSLKRLLDEIMKQLDEKVKKELEKEVAKLPKGKDDTVAKRNLVAIKILLDYQKIKSGSKTAPQPAGISPQQPPTPEPTPQ